MKINETLLFILLLLLLSVLVNGLPYDRQSSGLTEAMYDWSEGQSQISDRITQDIVGAAEGVYVGEHNIKGSNWSIPNIIRHWLNGG